MKRSLLLSLLLLCCYAGMAQPPYYYNAGSTFILTSSPTSSSNKKQQTLHTPGMINTPSAPPSGYITSIWYKSYQTKSNVTFTDLDIKVGQTTATTFSNANYLTGLTPALSAATYTIPTVTSGTWVEFPLTTPVVYDNTKSLVVEFSQTAVSNGFDVFDNANSNRRIYGTTGSSSGTLDGTLLPGIGISVVVPCGVPYNIVKSNLTTTSVDLDWSYPYNNDTLYEYELDHSPTDPPGSGYITTQNRHLSFTNLLPNTCYYIHLRTNCKVGSQQLISPAWALDSFCTLPECEIPPVTIDTAKVTGTTAIVSWQAVPGVLKYEYTVSIDTIPPTQGIFTTYTSVKLQGLTPNRPYYFMLRAYCQPVPMSPWGRFPFHTGLGTSVDDILAGEFNIEAYPNPAGNSITVYVNGERHDNARIIITDMTGKMVHTVPVSGDKTRVDLSDLSTGLYFVKYTDSVRNQVIKITKQ